MLCGARSVERRFDAHDRLHHLPGEFSVVRCTACGLMQTMPRPSGEALTAYYPEDYAAHRDAGEEPPPTAGPRSGVRGWLKSRFGSRRIWWTPDLPPGARVLELGSGAGRFARHALARGWAVHAVEPAAEAAGRLARDPRIRVQQRPAEAVDAAPGTFDAIFAWMVVEHLEDPPTVLRRVAAALRPGGYFVFSVPNAGSWELAVFRGRWYALQVPTHLWHFTPRTLRRLLVECGFDVERIFHQKVLRNITGSLEYLGGDRPGLAPLARGLARMLTPAWVSFGVGAALAALRQGGRLTVVARTPGAR